MAQEADVQKFPLNSTVLIVRSLEKEELCLLQCMEYFFHVGATLVEVIRGEENRNSEPEL